MMLETDGYRPNVPESELKPVCGASWVNWVRKDDWTAPDGRKVTMEQALEEMRNKAR